MRLLEAFQECFTFIPEEKYILLIQEQLDQRNLFKITDKNESNIRKIIVNSLELGQDNITKILLLACYNFSLDTERYLLDKIKNFGDTEDADGKEYDEETLKKLGNNKFSPRDDYDYVIVYNEKFVKYSENLLKVIPANRLHNNIPERLCKITELLSKINTEPEYFFEQVEVHLEYDEDSEYDEYSE